MYICGEQRWRDHTCLTVRPRLKEAVVSPGPARVSTQRSICFILIKIGYNGYCQRGF